MGVGSGLYMYDVVIKRSRSLSHLLMSSCPVDACVCRAQINVYLLIYLFCIAFHIFVVGGDRDFKFGMYVNGSKC